MNYNDFYEFTTEKTAEVLQKTQRYIDLALELGDVAYQEKAGEVIIKIRIPKKEKKDA